MQVTIDHGSWLGSPLVNTDCASEDSPDKCPNTWKYVDLSSFNQSNSLGQKTWQSNLGSKSWMVDKNLEVKCCKFEHIVTYLI